MDLRAVCLVLAMAADAEASAVLEGLSGKLEMKRGASAASSTAAFSQCCSIQNPSGLEEGFATRRDDREGWPAPTPHSIYFHREEERQCAGEAMSPLLPSPIC